MAKIAIISLDNQDIHTDARIQRQIKYLSLQHEIHVITYGNETVDFQSPAKSVQIVGSLFQGIGKRRLNTLLSLPSLTIGGQRAYERWYWQRPGHKEALEKVLSLRPQVIHANDWWSLPVAVRAAGQSGAKVILDLHEYSPDEYNTLFWQHIYRPMIDYFLRAGKPFVCASTTVNQMIANRYQREYGLEPLVLRNTPDIEIFSQYTQRFDNRIKLVHHGHALPNRQLELMIDIVRQCDERFSLTFILIGNQKYIAWLKQYAQKNAPGKVFFLPGVKPNEITQVLEQFDIGLSVFKDTHYNYLAALPNKFFDYVSAGLAVCIGPSPAMRELAEQYEFGIIAHSFKVHDVAATLNAITRADIEPRRRCAIEASSVLNAEVEMVKLLDLYQRILS